MSGAAWLDWRVKDCIILTNATKANDNDSDVIFTWRCSDLSSKLGQWMLLSPPGCSGQCPPPRRGRTQGPSSLQLPASSGQGHRRRFPRTKYSQHPPWGRPGSPRQWHLGRQPSHSSTRTTGICPGTGQGDLSFNFSYRQEFTDFNNQEIFLDTGCILQGSLLLLYGF